MLRRQLVLASALLWQRSEAADAPSEPIPVNFPDPDSGVDSLAARAKAQHDTASKFQVFYGFSFHDRAKESGITFVHRAMDDSARDYRNAVHYDHGNGIATADVDGDGLEDVYFLNQLGANQLWMNLGGGRFSKAVGSGVTLANRVSVGASFADIDNDGDQDLFVTSVRGGNALFQNDGHGHFIDISRSAGVDYVGHSSGAVFFDYDNDGLLDLYVCNVGQYTSPTDRGRGGFPAGLPNSVSGHLYPERRERGILYRNGGRNRFEDVTEAVGLGSAGWSGDASFADLDGDGFPELYTLNMQGASHYWSNGRGKRFVDRTTPVFNRTSWGAMGLKFFDWDNDGDQDLFVTDMHSDMSEDVGPESENLKPVITWPPVFLDPTSSMDRTPVGNRPHNKFLFGNALYSNRGGGRFEEVSERANAETYWPWGPSVGDLNADGWQDAFIAAGMSFPWRYGINSILLNNRANGFLGAEFILGVEPRRGGRTHTPWFDVDCTKGAPPAELCRENEGTRPPAVVDFCERICKGRTGKVVAMAPYSSRSSVVFDLDYDGDLDIVTVEFNSEPQVLISSLAARRNIHWLKVALVGTISNRNGLGATVRVTVGQQVGGSRVLTQWNDGKSGYLSQSVLPLYFGLGDDADIVKSVEVAWPSGRRQLVRDVTINTTLTVTETR